MVACTQPLSAKSGGQMGLPSGLIFSTPFLSGAHLDAHMLRPSNDDR